MYYNKQPNYFQYLHSYQQCKEFQLLNVFINTQNCIINFCLQIDKFKLKPC